MRAMAAMPESTAVAARAKDSAERSSRAASASLAASAPAAFFAEVTRPVAEWEAKAAARHASVHDEIIIAIGVRSNARTEMT